MLTVGIATVSLTVFKGTTVTSITGLIDASLLTLSNSLKMWGHLYKVWAGGMVGFIVRFLDRVQGILFLSGSILLVLSFAYDAADPGQFPLESAVLMLLYCCCIASGAVLKLSSTLFLTWCV